MVDQFAVVNGTVPSSGTFDITHADITTWDEVGGCVIFLSGFKTTIVTDARQCTGYVDKAGGQRAVCSSIPYQDRQWALKRDSLTKTLVMLDSSGGTTTIVFEASWSASLTNGVRLTVDTGTESGFAYTALLFSSAAAGAGACEVFSGGTTGSNTMSFEASILIGTHMDLSVGTGIGFPWGVGFAVNDTGFPQVSQGRGWPRVITSGLFTDADMICRTGRFGSYIASSGTEITSTVTSFSATGYAATASSGAPDCYGLAIKFGDADRTAAVAVEDIPAVGGLASFTGLGLNPAVCLGVSSGLTTDDTLTDGEEAETYGLGMWSNAGDEGSANAFNQDGLELVTPFATTSTFSYGAAIALLNFTRSGAGAIGAWGSFSQMLSTGFELDFQTESVPGFPPTTFDLKPGKLVVLGISGIAMGPIQEDTLSFTEDPQIHLGLVRLQGDTLQLTEAASSILRITTAVSSSMEPDGRVSLGGGLLGNVSVPQEPAQSLLGHVSLGGGLLGRITPDREGD